MRNITFAEGELYHIYNRGVDKRPIFKDYSDFQRFFYSIGILNNSATIGSLDRVIASRKHGVFTNVEREDKLVKIVAYCIHKNHFHLILEEIVNKGIERYMHKLGMAHSKFINTKYNRSGALFQGSFKANHIDSNEYLLHVSAYVNLNERVHGYIDSQFTKSSWEEYTSNLCTEEICEKDIILGQFKNKAEYKKFAENTLSDITLRKDVLRELENEGVELVNTI